MAPIKRSKAPPKPVLYFDVLNTLLHDRGGVLTPTPFAQKFVDAVKTKFQLRLLSSLEEHIARAHLKQFKIEPEYVAYRRALGKASAIGFHESFYWIDDDPSPADLLRLADERCSDRVITVNKRDGATELTLKKLMATVEEHATAKEAAE